MISSGINLVMTVIGFAVSTMFIVFVCTRLICARIQLNASRRSFHITSRSDLSILERGLHGLEPLVVANFPTKKYSDQFFSSSEDAQKGILALPVMSRNNRDCEGTITFSSEGTITFPVCTVCLSEYQSEDTLRILPFCGHSFHANCIDIWLQQHSTCPVCRVSLRDIPEKKRFMQPMFSSAFRSQYGTELLVANSYPCLSNNQRLSMTGHESRSMDPTEEDQFRLGDDEAVGGESNSLSSESNSVTKDFENKHMESPSNL